MKESFIWYNAMDRPYSPIPQTSQKSLMRLKKHELHHHPYRKHVHNSQRSARYVFLKYINFPVWRCITLPHSNSPEVFNLQTYSSSDLKMSINTFSSAYLGLHSVHWDQCLDYFQRGDETSSRPAECQGVI